MLKSFAPAEPRSANQDRYIHAIRKNTIVLCTGIAGSGKTYVAISEALRLINKNPKVYKKIILVRPYMPSGIGELLGSLPGDVDEKIGPYVQNIKDILSRLVTHSEIAKAINLFEFATLSLCRGRSFEDCIVIVDEAQNVPVSADAAKMLLTRLGNNAKMILCGDTDQVDLKNKNNSSLGFMVKLLHNIHGIKHVELNDYEDVQRSSVVKEILKRFDALPK